KALQLDANNARVLAIKDLLDIDQNTISMDGIELDVASDEPITLSFKDAQIKEVFGILSELSGINFIFDEGIRSQSITVLLEKASFAQAMELIMQMNGLSKKVLNSKTIIIYPESREKAKQYEDQLIQTFYLSHIDAKKAVNLLRTMLQLRKIYVHEERNALVIRDKPDVIRLAEQILAAADRSDSEVLFDVEVLGVRDTDALNFGPRLSTYSTSLGFSQDGTNILDDTLGPGSDTSGLTTNLSGLQTFYTLPTAAFDFAKTLNSTELLASPKIRVKNKEKAKVHIGKRDPIVTTTQVGTTDTTTQNVQYVDSGIKLDIEPNVQLDGTVLTKIKLEVSSAERLDSADTTGESPIALTTTNAETSLVLLDGARTILGGLYENNRISNKSTIPFLGEIPWLGSLFTNYSNSDEKREIILSITPYIIKKLELPEVDVATIWSGGEDNLKDGPNFGAFVKPLLSDVEATKPLAAPGVTPVSVTIDQEGPLPSSGPAIPGQAAPTDEQAGAVPEEKNALPSAVAGEPESVEMTPAEEAVPSVAAAGEIVPIEQIEAKQEVGQPLAAEMPDKNPAIISFSAPEQAEQGQDFSVAVLVSGVEQLYSAPLFISYDPAALELVSLSEGDFLKQAGQTTIFSHSPNQTTGQIIVGYKQGPGGTGATGSGTLFNAVFKPVSAGETELKINRVNFRNPEGARLPVVPEAIVIEVR
ncbi:MAG: cohesin domain-containing protein, partial [Desulfuromonadales bacterium]